MQTLLIYLPGKQGASPQLLIDAGLGELLDAPAGGAAPSFFSLDPPKGPDSGGGVVAFWGQGLPAIADYVFEPGKGAKRERFWLGRPKEGQLAPADLARPKLQLGADVVLADGQAWHIPIARQLPQLLGLGDDDQWSGVVVPQYREFYDAAWAALDWLAPADGERPDLLRTAAEFACRVLSINYRVNRDVASFLGLLDTDKMFEIAVTTVEFANIVELFRGAQKKSPSTGDAPPADVGPPG